MTVFALRLPDDLKEQAAAQAAEAGVSLNQFIAVAVASRVGAQAEAERYFRTRGARTSAGRAKAILARAGNDTEPRDDDTVERSNCRKA
jgi:hypothetical protein